MDFAWLTLREFRNDTSPSTIMEFFILLVIVALISVWRSVSVSILSQTPETLKHLFSESVLYSAVDNVPLRLPVPCSTCLRYICKSRSWLDYNACDQIRETWNDLMICLDCFVMHVLKYGRYETIAWFTRIVLWCMWWNRGDSKAAVSFLDVIVALSAVVVPLGAEDMATSCC
jgi:hypothetical protein